MSWLRASLSGGLGIVLLVVGWLGMQALSRSRRPPSRVKAPPMRLSVETIVATETSRVLSIRGFGTAQAAKQVQIVPEVSGIVKRTIPDFKPGRIVKKGELLFAIDDRPLMLEYRRLVTENKSLRAQIVLARKALFLDNRTMRRYKQLLQKQAVDRATYDRERLRIRDRQQRLESLQQSQRTIQMQIQKAQLQLSYTKLRAPFAARVTTGGIDAGNYVTAGRAVATLESIDALEVPIAVTLAMLMSMEGVYTKHNQASALVAALRKLPPVKITVAAAPHSVWKGRVVRIGGSVDPRTRTVDMWVRIKLPQTKGGLLLPGAYCQARLPYRRAQKVLTLPRQALHGAFVYIVKEGKLRFRKVEVLHRGADHIYLQSGITVGEQIVISELNQPIDGMAVHVASTAK